jgi:DEAD/DEAH box helicase domain-containing protein
VTSDPSDNPGHGINEYIAALKASPRFGSQVVHHEDLAGRPARYGKVAPPWPPDMVRALAASGVGELYGHQAAAISRVRQGKDVIVATPTASGKSLIYNLPVFEEIRSRPEAKALYLFPLKALAQDQLRAINELAAGLEEGVRPVAAIYDGDTTAYQRKKMRQQQPQILITNPDMLHLSLLGYHDRWGPFFGGLTHVIIDEVHTYRGVFGSHMAWVLARLQRICSLYGSRPIFVLSSATIGNPAELALLLLGREAEVVAESAAPQARRHFLFMNPYDSPAYTACQLLEAALKRGLRTIVYTQSRKLAELIFVWTRARLGPLADRLSSYRAGYLAEERRDIETRLADGRLLGVTATSALELGIDIGALDICILVGYPGTVMTTWQRSGRVGRSQRESLTVMVAQQDALDQYFMRNPADFFKRGVEAAVLNPDNKTIMKQHLLCAAAEQPLESTDPLLARAAVQEAITELSEEGGLLLAAAGDRWFASRRYPHRHTDLRGSGRAFTIREADTATILGEIDGHRSLHECYPGAIYLHRGQTWLVTGLDLEGREVRVRRRQVNYFTRPLSEKRTEILKVYHTSAHHNFRVSFGALRVIDKVTGFQRRLVANHKLIASEPLDLPPSVFETEGLWIEIPARLQKEIEQGQYHFMGGIHALEHGLIGIFPLLVLCDRNDVGGIACPFHEQLPGAGVFIYDGYQGGIGLSSKAYEKIEKLLSLARQIIGACPCEIGCPSCVHSPKCGSGNRPMDKSAALLIIDNLLRPGTERREKPESAADRLLVRRPRKLEPQTPPPRYGVFDLETKRSAADVGGWHRAVRMGLSVAVLYDSKLDAYRTYLERDVPALVRHLKELDLVVGFNIKRFDNRVLSAYTSFDLNDLPTLDILEEITTRLGYRLSLDRLAENTLGVKKSGDGLQALQWYKEGRMAELTDYCRRDVEITRDLYLFGLEKRYLLFSNKAGNLVRLPVSFAKDVWSEQRSDQTA